MKMYDVSLPISERLPVWPGDPATAIEPAGSHDPVAILPEPSISRLIMGTHTGTHVDPPAHFIPGGVTADYLDLDTLIGPAWLLDLPAEEQITAAALAETDVPPGISRLLIRTRNSESAGADAGFDPGFAGLTPDAARWLLGRNTRLVGIDGPSIEPFVAPGEPVHRALLAAGVVIIEGLVLAHVPPGPCHLICLPLKLVDGDGAPARTVLLYENSVEK